MNAEWFLVPLSAAALLVAAPLSVQDFAGSGARDRPVAVGVFDPALRPVAAPVAYGATEYMLKVVADESTFAIHGGRPGIPAALMVGVDELHVQLPYDAVLRVDPVAIFLVDVFGPDGSCHVDLSSISNPPVDFVEFLVQALSVDGDIHKLCTSELIWVRTDLARHWEFEPRG